MTPIIHIKLFIHIKLTEYRKRVPLKTISGLEAPPPNLCLVDDSYCGFLHHAAHIGIYILYYQSFTKFYVKNGQQKSHTMCLQVL